VPRLWHTQRAAEAAHTGFASVAAEPPSSSGLGHRPFKPEIAGSNPAGGMGERPANHALWCRSSSLENGSRWRTAAHLGTGLAQDSGAVHRLMRHRPGAAPSHHSLRAADRHGRRCSADRDSGSGEPDPPPPRPGCGAQETRYDRTRKILGLLHSEGRNPSFSGGSYGGQPKVLRAARAARAWSSLVTDSVLVIRGTRRFLITTAAALFACPLVERDALPRRPARAAQHPR
jgi:hypothetical protein